MREKQVESEKYKERRENNMKQKDGESKRQIEKRQRKRDQ